MASFCGSHYPSCQETTNFARICRIVVDVLRDVLWQVLIHEIPPADLPNKVQTNQNKLGNLDVEIKTWLLGISPSSPEIPIAKKFDVSSLYTLIRNLCNQVQTPTNKWGKTPPPGGTTLGDDIERIREFRNTLYGHATRAKINTKDFNKLWISIRNVVKRFDLYFSSSCKGMKCDFDKEIVLILTCYMDKSLQDAYMEKVKEITMLSGTDRPKIRLSGEQEELGAKRTKETHSIQQGAHKSQELLGSVEIKQFVTAEASTQTAQGVVKDQEGQGQNDADAPITQEHINHARLCNALTTVCANALRNILLTNVPAPHTDIYQAILANNANLKRLNKDQYQLVFPDPQGLSTGKVEEFDISLLYTIIRNVSSVPAPSNGWGNSPANNPRDTTLGASVERIRSYRNSISGHSVDGKISQQEFEDYWAKIDEVLREIEIVIGNHGYLEDLEKRKNQTITPHEARELQKKFQEYKKQTEDDLGKVKQQVGNVKQEVDDVRKEVVNLTQEIGTVKQHVEVDVLNKDDLGKVKQQVGNVKQEVDDVRKEVVNLTQEIGTVKQHVEVDVVKKDDLEKVKQQVGNVKEDVDDIKQLVGVLEQEVDKVKQKVCCVDQIHQIDIDVVKKDIVQMKETLQKPDVREKDLQTEESMSASGGSNQPISQNESSLQSFQTGEQQSTVKTEKSPAPEADNDPEADKQEPVIPVEILRMDEGSIQMFKEALKDRKVKVYNIRVMIVGQFGVGKSTLCKRLLGDDVNISERKSTEGIDVHIHRCRVSLANYEWLKQDQDAEITDKLQRYCKLLNDQSQGSEIADEQAGNSKVMYQMESALDIKENVTHHVESTNLGKDQKSVESSASKLSNLSYEAQRYNEDKEGIKASSKVIPGNKRSSFNIISKENLKASGKAMPGDKKNSFSNISKEDLFQMLDQSVKNADKSVSKETVKNILQFLKENSDKLVGSREEYAPLAMWDFAGQYVYYTTHQTFLTQRAIYLLVLDLTQQATDQVKDDDCFFDIEGKKECQVHDLEEIWLNSIHSCAPSPESRSPPVILVGSHLDKIEQDKRQERSESVFQQIRSHDLRGRPARLHLADKDFSIDNTIEDPVIKDLQKKIVELASQQPHWGESIPGRWLPLEEWLMSLKARGVKVIPYHFLEKMNLEGDVRIESNEELGLFLKFQHDIGNILYFSTEELREWIVLEPQWLIKAMKSLITADMFILTKHPEAEKVWHRFKEEGKLTQELLDIIWSKEHEPDLYNYKELILLLMEQLNIIARPMLFTEDGDKEDDFFLAPCMLCQTAPRDVISPDVKPEMESSSVLCFVFMGRFLPSPIFHRLLAVCVAKWPILKRRGTNQIFCGCGIFEIDHHYRLTLYFKSYAIFARITHAAAKLQTLDAKVCITVRKFLNDSLSKILGNLSQNLKFEFFIQCQCPQSVGDSLDNLFSVKELSNIANLTCRYHDDHSVESNSLLKYWFTKEVIS